MYGKMYEEIVDSIAAQYAPIQGQSCKEPGSFPVYLAPADVCGIGGLDTTLKICKDYPRMKTDYSNHDHHLVCVSSGELGELWKTGHCHDPETGQPFLYNDGRLKCCRGSEMKCCSACGK